MPKGVYNRSKKVNKKSKFLKSVPAELTAKSVDHMDYARINKIEFLLRSINQTQQAVQAGVTNLGPSLNILVEEVQRELTWFSPNKAEAMEIKKVEKKPETATNGKTALPSPVQFVAPLPTTTA